MDIPRRSILRVVLTLDSRRRTGAISAVATFAASLTDARIAEGAANLEGSPFTFSRGSTTYTFQRNSAVPDTSATARPTAPPVRPPPPPTNQFTGGVRPTPPPSTSAPAPAPSGSTDGTDAAGSAGDDEDKDVETNMMIIIIVCAALGAGIILFAIWRKGGGNSGPGGRTVSHQNPVYQKGAPVAGPGPVGEKDKAKGLVRVESM